MTDESSDQTGKRVLVVDDDNPARQTIARMLEAGGFSVVQAASGTEALERLAAGTPWMSAVSKIARLSGIRLSVKAARIVSAR